MATGGYDGSININTKIDSSGFNKGIKGINKGLDGITSSLKGLAAAAGIAFGVAAAVNFGKASVSAATELSNAMLGLQSILQGQGRSFKQAQDFIQQYIADGLIPATNAITAYKNLASRGYTDTQIQTVLQALKDSAAFGRQASYTLGEAVQTATEGLKNENSILVDNAGVTKNVAQMWKDYAASIGTTADKLTKQQKIQAEVTGIMEETRFQTGDAAKLTGTYSGQIQQLGYNFNNLKIAVGNALIPIAQAVLPGLNAIITALTRVANLFAQVTTALFGRQAAQQQAVANTASNIASSSNDAAKAQNKLADATKKASKAADNSVASFDELNVLQQDTGSAAADQNTPDVSTGAAAGVTADQELGAGVTVSPAVQAAADTIKGIFSDLQKAAQPTIEAFQRFTESLEPIKDFAAKAFEDFYTDYLEPLGRWVLGKGLPNFLDTLTKFNNDVDWDNLNKALDDLWKALEPFTENVGEGLNWFLRNVWEPIAAYNYNVVLPKVLEILAAAIDILNQVIEKAKPSLQWFYDNVLVPIGKWAGQTLSDDLDLISDSLKVLDDLLKGDFPAASQDGQKALNDLGEIIKDFTGIDIPGAIQSVKDSIFGFGTWWNEHIVKWWTEDVSPWFTKEKWIGLFDTIRQSLSEKWTETTTWWNTLGPVKWWKDNVCPWFTKEKWTTLYENVKQSLVNTWGEVTTWWNKSAIIKWWNEDVSPWFTAKKWADMMSGVGEGFKTTFKNAVNSAIAIFNTFIGWINSKMHFQWDDIVIAGKKIVSGGSFQLFSIPQIPRLATGAVIPPRAEFAAILGDQRNGRNIEAPEGLIRSIVADEIAKIDIQPQVNVIASSDDAGFIRYVKFRVEQENRRVGSAFATGGGR